MPAFTKTIANITRLRSSRNGNPRFEVEFTDGTAANTETDSQVGYVITDRLIGATVDVEATKRGDIYNITPV